MGEPTVLPIDNSESIERASAAISQGLIIVLPTDTVYGIGADPFNPEAVHRLQDAKGRSDAFPPPVLLADVGDVDDLVSSFPEPARRLAEAYWPGPLTLILPAAQTSASLAEKIGTLGVRIPDLDEARALLRVTGPLAVSSANRHNEPPAVAVEEAIRQLGHDVALYLDGGPTPGATPSTVVDFSGPQMRVLRQGLITYDEIMRMAQGDKDA